MSQFIDWNYLYKIDEKYIDMGCPGIEPNNLFFLVSKYLRKPLRKNADKSSLL